ncbi:MAG: 16S rRNA (cytosine(1402)-N(4))-methyltransferase [Paludibacteraceae bacterium]|nr:16S rRNA (cytosine(1402)-N(4))-methyltransferase [Paludibacteraceae bacterium]
MYGELKNGRAIARNICLARAKQPIERTEELVAAALRCKVEDLGGLGSLGGAEGKGEEKGCRTEDDITKPKNDTTEPESKELNVPANAKKELAKVFQALRIEVNDELGALREMLVAARDLLKPGGRIAILTYHSLEDRLVKNFLRSGNLEGTIEKDFYGNNLSPFDVIEKGREASADEVERNPRARSAKLRVAEKRSLAKP